MSTLECPICKAKEVETNTPRTVYACGSSDYDQRPGTLIPKCIPAPAPTGCDSAMLDWLEKHHVEFAEELHRIGWTSPTNAQWEKLKFFLRRIRAAIRAAMQAEQP